MIAEVVIPELIPELNPKLVRQDGIIEAHVSEYDAYRMLNNCNPITKIPYDWTELMQRLDEEGLFPGFLEEVFNFYEDLHGEHFDSYTNFQLSCSHFTNEELKLKTTGLNRLLRKVKRIMKNQSSKKDSEIMHMIKNHK